MANSALKICNSALIKLGASKIDSLLDSNKAAVLCNEQYSKMRDRLLMSHYWNFAIKRASLVEDATSPAFEWENRFVLPTDFLRAISTEYNSDEWVIEGGYLLTNESEINLKYIAKITTTTEFTPTFDEALAYMIAAELAYPLVQSRSLSQDMWKKAEQVLRDTRSFDAQEGSMIHTEANDWLDARVSGSGIVTLD